MTNNKPELPDFLKHQVLALAQLTTAIDTIHNAIEELKKSMPDLADTIDAMVESAANQRKEATA